MSESAEGVGLPWVGVGLRQGRGLGHREAGAAAVSHGLFVDRR